MASIKIIQDRGGKKRNVLPLKMYTQPTERLKNY